MNEAIYGNLKAQALVNVVNLFGQSEQRKITLGTLYTVTVEEAKDAIKKARTNNPDFVVVARFTVDL